MSDEKTSHVLEAIQINAGKAPVFMLHPLHGHLRCYTALISCLGPDRSYHGLCSRGLTEPAHIARSVEEMAADYLTEVLRIQPEGPYTFIGWSFGSMIALEMAHLLREQHEAAASVIAIDLTLETRGQVMANIGHIVRNFLMDEDFLFLTVVLYGQVTLDFLLHYKRCNGEEEKLAFVAQECMRMQLFDRTLSQAQILNIIRVQKANFDAAINYEPDLTDMNVTFILAGDLVPVFGSQTSGDDYRKLRPSRTRHIVPGCHHLNILSLPHVKRVAEIITKQLSASAPAPSAS